MSAVTLPYFPLYVGDFEADTTHLTAEQDGVYNRLLRALWRTDNCKLLYDEADLRRRLRLTPAQWKRSAEPVIRDYCRIEAGYLYNNRLMEEWQKARAAYERRAKAGARGGKAKASNARPPLQQCSSNQNQNQNQNQSYGPFGPGPGGKAEQSYELGDARDPFADPPFAVVRGGRDG